MDVTVIIVTRNTCALTRGAIRSVQDASGTLRVEIVVVDNASSDETATTLGREFLSVNLIRAGANLGFARACNLAAAPASGEFLLLLNSDARLKPAALVRAVAAMRAHPDCAVAGAQLLNPDGSRQNSIANFPTLATELLNKSLLRRIRPGRFPGKEQTFTGPVGVESVVGAFFLVRKAIWDRLGGLDERFFFFLEETDFCLRARQAGYRVLHLPDVEVWHEQGRSAGRAPAAARIEYWRSRYAYFQKHHSPAEQMALRTGLELRLFADAFASGLITLLSLGRSARWRNKFATHRALLAWHWRGRPIQAGLPRT